MRHIVQYVADTCGNDTLRDVLVDILDTPVSPELLPTAADGTIAQQTEKLVGPYELHDFYLYYVLRFGFSPTKIYHLARTAFDGRYEPEVLLAWLKNFYRRFFAQQFKRSCLPDGPKVGSVTLVPPRRLAHAQRRLQYAVDGRIKKNWKSDRVTRVIKMPGTTCTGSGQFL